MNEPAEICDIHDLRIDKYGCWACGHGGPITDGLANTWYRWAARSDLGKLASQYADTKGGESE